MAKLEKLPVDGIEGVSNAKEWFLKGSKQALVTDIKTEYSYIEDLEGIEDAFERILKSASETDLKAVSNALKILELPEDKRGNFSVGSIKHVGNKKHEADVLARGKAEFERFINPKFYENIPALDVKSSQKKERPRSGLSVHWDY